MTRHEILEEIKERSKQVELTTIELDPVQGEQAHQDRRKLLEIIDFIIAGGEL